MSRREGKQPMTESHRQKKRKPDDSYAPPRQSTGGVRIGSPRANPRDSAPIPFSQRFISPRAMSLYSQEYVARKMLIERELVEEKVNPEFVQTLKAKDWEVLMVIPERLVNDTLVREFYANLDAKHLEAGFVMVRKVKVPFTPAVINKKYAFEADLEDVDHRADIKELADSGCDPLDDLRVMIDKNCQWTYKLGRPDERKDLTTTRWPEDWRVKCKFIQNRLRPTDNITHFGLEDLGLLYAIEHGIEVNVGNVIFDEVYKHLKNPNRCIICPHLIHSLCMDAKVPEYKADHRPKNPRGIQRETKKPAKPSPSATPSASAGPSSATPRATLTPSDRIQLSIAHSLRKWMRMICCTQNDILANQKEMNRGSKIVKESRFAPSTTAFFFEDEVENMITRVIPDASKRDSDVEEDDDAESDASDEAAASEDATDSDE